MAASLSSSIKKMFKTSSKKKHKKSPRKLSPRTKKRLNNEAARDFARRSKQNREQRLSQARQRTEHNRRIQAEQIYTQAKIGELQLRQLALSRKLTTEEKRKLADYSQLAANALGETLPKVPTHKPGTSRSKRGGRNTRNNRKKGNSRKQRKSRKN